MATEASLAHVLVNRCSEHLPLYRESQIFAHEGITLNRSTPSNWVGHACWWTASLQELLLSTVLSSPVVFADDTILPVLDPGQGKTKTGRLWRHAVDTRPWCGRLSGGGLYPLGGSEGRTYSEPPERLQGLLRTDS
jgi:transposase